MTEFPIRKKGCCQTPSDIAYAMPPPSMREVSQLTVMSGSLRDGGSSWQQLFLTLSVNAVGVASSPERGSFFVFSVRRKNLSLSGEVAQRQL